ncbi:MAG: uracil-DNA glycosylase [Desulfurococcales archaeon]|nr:uracil-DNA glycosylase [Desulfurococcales archaeon]
MRGSKLERYEKLVEQIRRCTKCRLHATRKNPVPGEGSLEAEVMFVGEAPGRREDELGRPFVGMAGNLLTALLREIGLSREEVYITNIVKCRPPGNRDPRDDEIAACLPYLIEQIKIIGPKILVTLGRHAGRTIYGLAGLKWPGMSKAHGAAVRATVAGVSLTIFSTYHPAAALYNKGLRTVLQEDFRRLKSLLSGEGRGRTLFDYF